MFPLIRQFFYFMISRILKPLVNSSTENLFSVKVGIASEPDENFFCTCFNIIFIVSQLNATSSFRKLLLVGIIDSLTSSFEYVE